MIRHNIRTYASVILGLAFFIYVVIFLLTQNLDSIDFQKALSHISTTITINFFIWIIFIKWAWKWKIFYPWLVPFPCLSGEWTGTIKSTWKEDLPLIPVNVFISQNFFNIQVRTVTGESSSQSIVASFDIDEDRGQSRLLYSYLNTPKPGVRVRSEIHYGSIYLAFNGYKVTKMEGAYWTDRKTTGELILNKV